ncbi:MAG: hypothetical protein JOZ96_25825 [Acidobacteria bacterium]|nr:hypothetical protein [Acidobacteriota bacterium]
MKRQTLLLVALAAASSAAFCVLRAPCVEAKRGAVRLVTREVPLGREPAGGPKVRPWVSPDRRHVAYIAKAAGGEAAFVDGRMGKTYPAVANDPLSESGTGNPFTFSRDGRAAYVADFSKDRSARGPRRVVLDGAEGPSFDYIWSGGLHFSDDGRHFGYRAERGGKQFVILDGVEYGPYDDAFAPSFREYEGRGLVFAFDATRGGRQLLVVNGKEFDAEDPKGRELFFGEQARAPHEVVREGKHWIVWEGHEVGPFDEEIGLSFLHAAPRGGGWLVAFEAKRGGKQVAVVDGVEGRPYDYVGDIYISPGAAHTLYPARRADGEAFIVYDGEEGPTYSNVEIEGFDVKPFSPDGRHYFYTASRGEGYDSKQYVVADGREGRPYYYVTGVTYTPDGAHLLYLGYDRARGRTFLVRDGEEVASYKQMPEGDIRFSPDGRRTYFRLRKEDGGQDGLVVDGRAYYYDDVKDVEFSDDGRRSVFKAQRGRGWVMVVDGVESELYEPDGEKGEVGWSRDGRLALSKGGGRVAYVGRKGGREFVVVDGRAGARYDSVANLGFTPDGRHVVYTARRAGKSLVVVDGAESAEYDAFIPAGQYEKEGRLNLDGDSALSILARRGAELLRVELEIAGD